MAKVKACKICKRIYDEDKCPDCGSKEFTDAPKGRIFVTNAEKSEIAHKLNIKKNGEFAIKVR
jgi:RNA polymerase subunit RPABC4/transcription elongation factor Spt4